MGTGQGRWRLGPRLAFALTVSGAALLGTTGRAQETRDYFKNNCAKCHTIGGGRLVGPDLKDVGKQQDRAWIARFIMNPKGMIDGGDARARQLFDEFRGMLMPSFPDVTPERAEALLELLDEESQKEKSTFASSGTAIPDRPFTEAEIDQGRQFFVGARRFAGGGAACVSCHWANGALAIGGGRLGPDLTTVYGKLQGRKGLAGWLASPYPPTMQPIYKNHSLRDDEIIALVAFLEATNQEEAAAPTSVDRLNFFLLALGATAGGFVLFDFIWRRRFRGVRRSLVHPIEDKVQA
jgi:mono/diheme cytochrome c family protein